MKLSWRKKSTLVLRQSTGNAVGGYDDFDEAVADIKEWIAEGDDDDYVAIEFDHKGMPKRGWPEPRK